MSFRFGGHELDLDRRELRRDGAVVHVEPKVLELLAYLVAHRDRAVAKRELLDALWPDVVVTEGSLQRTVSLARAAVGDTNGDVIRTLPRFGYRFVATIDARSTPPPETARETARSTVRWSRAGDVHVAWQALEPAPGAARDVDVVVVNGWCLPMSACLEHPRLAASFAAMTRSARVILFDKRGVGLSDRVRCATLDERMQDLLCVLDAAGSRRAVVLGLSEGAPIAILLAATHPERVAGLVLVGAFARFTASSDHPAGWSAQRLRALREYVASGWGAGVTARQIFAPEHATGDDVRAWSESAERLGASPGAALDLLAMNEAIDARGVLGWVHVPTTVLHQTDDRVIDAANGRALARAIPGATLIEVPGEDHAFAHHATDRLLAAIDDAVRRAPAPAARRFLATVVHARVPADLRALARASLAALAPRVAARDDDDEVWACFEAAGTALRAAAALHATCAARGVTIACGIDASEIEQEGTIARGPARDRAAVIARAAAEGTTRCTALVGALVHDAAVTFVAIDGGDERLVCARGET
ncbi:Signal transduction response regulator / Tetratricopeptide repeat-containing protein [Sandaracinus amylolyticus]|uniref:Signal transduction response regulator / Tetratricopeptide repeat-containing protein n=2 Tax=Sandaracinus amylolyticus TaxID=927083 RepID=A0A0F6VYQ6_9BACT|nr:Signal transduction response regulator / Tetratricopeptide repeat-containing protein [Sandaracinus amylolyticus]